MAGLVDFNNPNLTFEQSIQLLKEIGPIRIKDIHTIDDFDKYMIDYFYEGVNVL